MAACTRQQDAGSSYRLMLKPTLTTVQLSQRKVWHVGWFRRCQTYESDVAERVGPEEGGGHFHRLHALVWPPEASAGVGKHYQVMIETFLTARAKADERLAPAHHQGT